MSDPNLTIQQAVSIHPDVVWREIDGEVVLLNVATGLYYGLDAVGSNIWRRLGETPVALASVRDALLTDYDDADGPTVERDLLALVTRLHGVQLIAVAA